MRVKVPDATISYQHNIQQSKVLSFFMLEMIYVCLLCNVFLLVF